MHHVAGVTEEHGAHPHILHSSQVDIRGLQLEGQHVAIVGGGMAAASLALAASAAGAAAVYLIHRRWADLHAGRM